MSNLNELIIRSNYYKAKHEYLEMKIAKFKKLQLACGSPIEPEEPEEPTEYIKTIVNDIITITEENEEEEPESDVSLFFTTQIIKDDNGKIKRSDCYNRYIKYCQSKQYIPKIKSTFFKMIEALVGKPIKSNVYCYKNYSLTKSDQVLTFNETVDTLIF